MVMVMRVLQLAACAVMLAGANATVGLSASRESRSSTPDDMATTLRWEVKKRCEGRDRHDDSGAIGPGSRAADGRRADTLFVASDDETDVSAIRASERSNQRPDRAPPR